MNSFILLEDVFGSLSRLCLCQQYEQCRVFNFLTKRAIVGHHSQVTQFSVTYFKRGLNNTGYKFFFLPEY
jgi:hypothetical protein